MTSNIGSLKKRNHSYKYCFVPMCSNTTVSTPDEIFLHVFQNMVVRMAWFQAAKREDTISVTTTAFACEDYFVVSLTKSLIISCLIDFYFTINR